MKEFGKLHVDSWDAVHLSCMVPVSDLPESYEEGRLHLAALGAFTRLIQYCALFFSGRQPHGGTAPMAPPNTAAKTWAYRAAVIAYPPRFIVNGEAKHALAALPREKRPVFITPEITGVKYVESHSPL